MLGSRFRYWPDDGGLLMYVRLPPFGRVSYNFATRRWSSLD